MTFIYIHCESVLLISLLQEKKKTKNKKRCHLPHFSEQNLIKTFFFFFLDKCGWEYIDNGGGRYISYKQSCTHVFFGKFFLYIMKQPNCFFGGIKKNNKGFVRFWTSVYQYPPAAFVNHTNMCGLESK